MTKVIFFGASFNPPHMAHVFAACYLSQHDFDRIIVAPTCLHPHGKELIPYRHRSEMCHLAMGWIPKVDLSDIEYTLAIDSTPNYTYKTIKHIKDAHPDWNIHFMLGSDTAEDLKTGKWKHSKELLEIARPFVLSRHGYKDKNPSILPDVSSTTIRQSIKGSIPLDIAKTFLPSGVYNYIMENKLYVN